MDAEKQRQETERKQQIDAESSLEIVKDPELKRMLTSILESVKHSDINKEAEEFKREIIKIPQRSQQQVFAFIPHQMAKVSIFFPMSDKELKEGERKINRLEHETGWGKIVIEGIKLAIFEEDIFLALIKIAKENIKTDKGIYVLETNMNDIINLLYGPSGYTRKSTERIERALQHFQLVRFELTTFDWKKKGAERLKTRVTRSIGNIVESYKYDERTKDLIIYFNPHFFAYFLESMLTNINFSTRRKLKKDGSKAILRFLSTHTQPSPMHILTVLNAINYNINQPLFTLRKKIKQFIAELKKNGVLGPKTKLYNNDMVYFEALKPKPQKTLPD